MLSRLSHLNNSGPYAVSTVALGGEPVHVMTRSDVAGQGISPATELLAETAVPAAKPDARTWLIGGGAGALATLLAKRLEASTEETPRLLVTTTDLNQFELTRRTLALNELEQATVVSPLQLPAGERNVDLVVLEVPRDRQLARRWLCTAFHSLTDGGALYLAGANDQGIRPVISDAERLFGEAQLLTYRRHNRVARVRKSERQDDPPGWATAPGIRPDSWYEFDIPLAGAGWLRPHPGQSSLHLKSLSGVFSYDRLDPGTELLLEHLPDVAGRRVLDMGCGYGLIGLLAAFNGAGQVDLVDVNLLAVASARENARQLGVANVEVKPSDLFSALAFDDRSYDLIVSNPPFHQGKAVDYSITDRMIRQAGAHLTPDGRLILVANAFIRYEPALQQHFSQVRKLAETSRYQLFAAGKPIDRDRAEGRGTRSRR